ncbi:MAG: Type 1 glutamine amidotransferase-like domain-containing protein [Cyclobacteriaceae bacterium]|nr:Type 1 glutamine amidotransferase-like domain-containing protein [Cyclobacteriaceae bacterium]MCH8517102.1 Type 1 glutamine amidotransferase-like domain-containing protein [Cyclobacteriaceae bacterium]
MKHLLYLLLIITLPSYDAFAQGKLVIMGGGAEQNGGWSDTPYQWAVDRSSNKRVAIMGAGGSPTNFLPNYFISLGAEAAQNFTLSSRNQANDAAFVDEISSFDVIFFRGGNQNDYYTRMQGTSLATALENKFADGGVLMGTSAGLAILSEVIFTSAAGIVFPDDGLVDVNSSLFRLENDLLNVFSGYIFDSHFIERGRFARLAAFLTRWYLDNSELIAGIGVDDETALAIDEDGFGIVYGTGGVSMMHGEDHRHADNRILSTELSVSNLVEGQIFDLNQRMVFRGPDQPHLAGSEFSIPNKEMIVFGTASFSEMNQSLFDEVLTTSPSTALVVSDQSGLASQIQSRLQALGVAEVIIQDLDGWIQNPDLHSAKDLVLMASDDANALGELDDESGKRLRAALLGHGRLAFAGAAATWSGAYYATNVFSQSNAAIRGALNYRRGFEIYPATIFSHNAFDDASGSTDFYENVSAAVKYGMVRHQLKSGYYLNRNTGMRLQSMGDDQLTISSFGTHSGILMEAREGSSALGALARHTGDVRNIAAFEGWYYHFLAGDEELTIDYTLENEEEEFVLRSHSTPTLKSYPNPSRSGQIRLENSTDQPWEASVYDSQGRLLMQKKSDGRVLDLHLTGAGIYLIRVETAEGHQTIRQLIE